MTYIFGDINGNGVLHELAIYPDGDVPDFFVWPAFHGTVYQQYQACNNYSPHNDSLAEHVESLDIEVCGNDVDTFIAYLDAVPRIHDVLWEINQAGGYEELVVIPMLLADSTHTQEVTDLLEEAAHLIEGMEVIVREPFFEEPFMQRRLRDAVLGMAQYVRAAIPADVPDHNIGVLLASLGTPYVPPYPEFGYVEGDIFSNLVPTEDACVEQVQPASSLVTTVSLPDEFSGTPTKLLVTFADQIPVTGAPVAVLATINNTDSDGDGVGDVEEILTPSRDLVLAIPDVGVVRDYYVVVAQYMEGGGQFQPVPGVDYIATSELVVLGQGQTAVSLELQLVP